MDIPLLLQVFLWGTLVQLAVYDAREHRIPNKSVITLIILALLIKVTAFTGAISYGEIFTDIGAGAVFFLAGFMLYLLRAMAPGDVKLLGGVGFLVGWNNGLTAAYFIAVAMIVVGSFYYFFFRAQTYHPSLIHSVKALLTQQSSALLLKRCLYSFHSSATTSSANIKKTTNRMPFAPVVVVGLTLYQYYGG